MVYSAEVGRGLVVSGSWVGRGCVSGPGRAQTRRRRKRKQKKNNNHKFQLAPFLQPLHAQGGS